MGVRVSAFPIPGHTGALAAVTREVGEGVEVVLVGIDVHADLLTVD